MKNFDNVIAEFEKTLPTDLYSWTYNIPKELLSKATKILTTLPKENTQVIIDPGTDGCCAAIILSALIDIKGVKLLSFKEIQKNTALLKDKYNIFLDVNSSVIISLLNEDDYDKCIIINHYDSVAKLPVHLFLSIKEVCTSQIIYDILMSFKPSMCTDQMKLFAVCGALSDATDIKGPILDMYKDVSNKVYTSKSFSKFCNKLIKYTGTLRIEEDISPIFNRVSRMTSSQTLYAVPLYVNKVLRIMNKSVYSVDADKTFVEALHLPDKCEYLSVINEKLFALNSYYNELARKVEAIKISESGVPIYLITRESAKLHEYRYDILTNCVGAVMGNIMSKYGTTLIVLFKLSDGSYKGVMRDYQDTDLHKHIQLACHNGDTLAQNLGGHYTAMGFNLVNEEMYTEFLDYMSDVSLQKIPTINKENYYNSARVYIPKEMVRADIFSMMSKYSDIPKRYIPQLVVDAIIPNNAKPGIIRVKRDDYTFLVYVGNEENLSKVRGKEVQLIWHFPGKASISTKNF